MTYCQKRQGSSELLLLSQLQFHQGHPDDFCHSPGQAQPLRRRNNLRGISASGLRVPTGSQKVMSSAFTHVHKVLN